MEDNNLSKLSKIVNPPNDPMNLFKKILNNYHKYKSNFVTMNIATINEKYSILNRTVVYRGLVNDCIAFVTERNSQKYKDILNNDKVAVTLLFMYTNDENINIREQVRINGKAVELPEDQIQNFWDSDPIFAKIRNKICECGKPIDWDELKMKHDKILKAYEEGHEKFEKPDSYTAFKIVPELIDFYYAAGHNAIADRVRYTKGNDDNNTWTHTHVCT